MDHLDRVTKVRLRAAMSETFTPLQTKEPCHVEVHRAAQSDDRYPDRPQLRTPPASEPSSLLCRSRFRTTPTVCPFSHTPLAAVMAVLSLLPHPSTMLAISCTVSVPTSGFPLPDSPAACVTTGFFLGHINPQLFLLSVASTSPLLLYILASLPQEFRQCFIGLAPIHCSTTPSNYQRPQSIYPSYHSKSSTIKHHPPDSVDYPRRLWILLDMCYQVVERFSVCRCLYYRHSIDPCAAHGQRGHTVQEKTVLVGYACGVHSSHRPEAIYGAGVLPDSGYESGPFSTHR